MKIVSHYPDDYLTKAEMQKYYNICVILYLKVISQVELVSPWYTFEKLSIFRRPEGSRKYTGQGGVYQGHAGSILEKLNSKTKLSKLFRSTGPTT